MERFAAVTLHLARPPRVRVEWVIAVARVVLATGSLVAVTLDPAHAGQAWPLATLLGWYLACSLGILALVWTPVRFGRGWDVALHAFDLLVFTMLMVMTSGTTSPFFLSLFFLLTCATLRWQLPGTLWTAGAAMAAYAGASLFAASVLRQSPFTLDDFLIRAVYLGVVTALLGYIGVHQFQFHGAVGRLATWPRTVSRNPRDVVAEVLGRAADLLNAPRAVLVWEDPQSGRVHLAWSAGGEVAWTEEPEGAFGALVLPSLEGRAFSAADARHERGLVLAATPRGFSRRQDRPIDERLRARFDMRAVQSWPLDGELVHGRLFCLDKTRMPLDDLLVGEFVARLAASRLDSLYLLDRLRDATALEERMRVARDLHDSLLQSQAGAALQLMAARRLLDRNPEAAKQRLDDVQQLLEHGELDMRSFIRNLRPQSRGIADMASVKLCDRLEDLRQRMERRWDLKVALRLDTALDTLDDDLSDHVYRLVQEGVVNAARHADASVVRVDVSIRAAMRGGLASRSVHLTIADDGKGFPFVGSYDLPALTSMDRGPVTLKERVAELRGDLTLRSSEDAGTELLITVPLAHA